MSMRERPRSDVRQLTIEMPAELLDFLHAERERLRATVKTTSKRTPTISDLIYVLVLQHKMKSEIATVHCKEESLDWLYRKFHHARFQDSQTRLRDDSSD